MEGLWAEGELGRQCMGRRVSWGDSGQKGELVVSL